MKDKTKIFECAVMTEEGNYGSRKAFKARFQLHRTSSKKTYKEFCERYSEQSEKDNWGYHKQKSIKEHPDITVPWYVEDYGYFYDNVDQLPLVPSIEFVTIKARFDKSTGLPILVKTNKEEFSTEYTEPIWVMVEPVDGDTTGFFPEPIR